MQIQDAVYLLTASSFYGMSNDRLKELCARNITTQLNHKNVLDVLDAAHNIQSDELKVSVVRYFVDTSLGCGFEKDCDRNIRDCKNGAIEKNGLSITSGNYSSCCTS
jgi:hypothetical protein